MSGFFPPHPSPVNVRIVEAEHMVIPVEDWTRVRSPSRARRRMRQGHPQQVFTRFVPNPELVLHGGVLYGHPATVRAVREMIAQQHPGLGVVS